MLARCHPYLSSHSQLPNSKLPLTHTEWRTHFKHPLVSQCLHGDLTPTCPSCHTRKVPSSEPLTAHFRTKQAETQHTAPVCPGQALTALDRVSQYGFSSLLTRLGRKASETNTKRSLKGCKRGESTSLRMMLTQHQQCRGTQRTPKSTIYTELR